MPTVYLAPHATKPRFKLGKSVQLLDRFRLLAEANAQEFNWTRTVALDVQTYGKALRLEQALRRIDFVHRAKLQRKGRGLNREEWHHISVFDRLVEYVTRNQEDLGCTIRRNIRSEVETLSMDFLRSPKVRLTHAERPVADREKLAQQIAACELANQTSRERLRSFLNSAAGTFTEHRYSQETGQHQFTLETSSMLLRDLAKILIEGTLCRMPGGYASASSSVLEITPSNYTWSFSQTDLERIQSVLSDFDGNDSPERDDWVDREIQAWSAFGEILRFGRDVEEHETSVQTPDSGSDYSKQVFGI